MKRVKNKTSRKIELPTGQTISAKRHIDVPESTLTNGLNERYVAMMSGNGSITIENTPEKKKEESET